MTNHLTREIPSDIVWNLSNDAFVVLKFSIQAQEALLMTVRSALTIATVAGLGILACPARGHFEDESAVSWGRRRFGDSSGDSRCCSVEDSTLALGILEDWKIEVEAPPAPDATASGSGPNQEFAVQTDPGTADLEAARVAAPPQSGLSRMLSAVIDLGSKR